MREIRLSGSEGGGTGNSTGPPYPYRTIGGLENFAWLSGMAAMDTRCVHLHRTDEKKTTA